MPLFGGPPDVGKLKAKRDIDGLIRALNHRESFGAAADALGRIGAPAVGSLIAALKNKDERVRRGAAFALGMIGEKQAVEPLIASLHDVDAVVRQNAAEALGNIGDPRAVEPLYSAFKENDWYVGRYAALALWRFGDASAYVEGLVSELSSSFSSDLREAAAKALVEIGAPAVEPLVAVLKDRKGSGYDSMVIDTLGKIGDPRAINKLIAILKIADRFNYAREHSAKALVDIGAPAVKSLIAVLKDSKEDYVRSEAAKALGKIGDARAIDPLLEAFKNDDTSTMPLVESETLAGFGAPMVEPLIACLKSESFHIRDGAQKALIKIGAPAVEPLCTILKGTEVSVSLVVEALGSIGDTRAIEPLVAILRDCDVHMQVRRQAADALDTLGWQAGMDETGIHYWMMKRNWRRCVEMGPPAVEPLIAALKGSDDAYWSQEMVETLGEIGDTRAVEPLVDLLGKPNLSLRKATLEVLEKLDWHPNKSEEGARYWITKGEWDECVTIGSAAVGPLVDALASEKDERQRAALDTLGKIVAAKRLEQVEDPSMVTRAVQQLIRLLDDPDKNDFYTETWQLRTTAATLLKTMFQAGILSENCQQLVRAQKKKINCSHDDAWEQASCGNDPRLHKDTGIGIDFSL